MRFELFIATRYLRAKRRQAFIGIITGISMLGVAAGVASLIVALAINNGFRQDLQDRLLGSTSHVSLLRIADRWHQRLAVRCIDRLSKQPHVVAAAPAIFEQVLISRGPRARGAVLKGMIPADERKVSDLLNSMKKDRPDAARRNTNPSATDTDAELRTRPIQSPDSLEGVEQRVAAMPPIILGKDMADNLGATVGSVVLVTSPQGELTPFGMVPKYNRFRVAGIFNSGFFDYDSSLGLHPPVRCATPLRAWRPDLRHRVQSRRHLQGRPDRRTTRSRPPAKASWPPTGWSRTRLSSTRCSLERLVTFITIGLIVFVAALNILISLIMMVMEKTKDIAVLMSMGTRKAQVRNLFIAQGVLIGVIGTAIGLVLGYAISYAGGHYHVISLSPEVYSIDYVPSHLAPSTASGRAGRCGCFLHGDALPLMVRSHASFRPRPCGMNRAVNPCQNFTQPSRFIARYRRTAHIDLSCDA